METLWFWLLAAMLTAYVVLDGFDFGAGMLHLSVAKTDEERRVVARAIGPVWDGNEVWLIAAGGSLFFSFPRVYAAAFSGFYLPLMIVLWLLVGRGLSLEWRSHHHNPLWRSFGDAVFWLSSTLLALLLGTALGNVLRGVPLMTTGWFWIPLFGDFGASPPGGALDWYTLLVGVFALAALGAHGSLYLLWKTPGAVHERCRKAAPRLWIAALAVGALVTAATLAVRPDHFATLLRRPWAWPFVLLAAGGLAGVFVFLRRRAERASFLSSCAFLAGLLLSTAAAVYPEFLRSTTTPEATLTAHNAAAPAHTLAVGLVWWSLGMPFVVAWFVWVYRSFRGKVSAQEGHGY